MVSTTVRTSENSKPIAPHTRFHAYTRGRPDSPCAPRTHPSALARATPRPTDADGDGPRGHGRTPVECRAHCASSKGRQRHVARVEPVGRGGTNGGGVALRPPFTPRRSPQRARNETARGEAAEGGKGVRFFFLMCVCFIMVPRGRRISTRGAKE